MLRLVAAILVASATVAIAPLTIDAHQPRRDQLNVSGDYTSNWDAITLVQRGDRVTGTYVCCGGGTIEGRIIENTVIRYTWTQPTASGRGVWTIDSSSQLLGTWGSGNDEKSGGRWDLVRKATIARP